MFKRAIIEKSKNYSGSNIVCLQNYREKGFIMANADEILRELSKVKHPENKMDIVTLNMVKEIKFEGDTTVISIVTPTADRKIQITLEATIRQTISKMGVKGSIKIKFEVDQNLQITGKKIPGVKRVIAVASGKGGVGKSSVTANLATQLKNRGKKVGILDADIYGPSIGKMFGINGRVALKAEEDKIWPVQQYGLELISFSFLIQENQPVIWRGPMLGKALEQFLYDIVWSDLDYLILDMPPGTGDVQLSLGQLIDLDGAIMVTTPQEVAVLDASRASAMFQQLKIPLIGVIENMSQFICPHCNQSTEIFSSGGGQKLSELYKIPLLGQIPLTLDMMGAAEKGNPITNLDAGGIVAQAFDKIIDNLEKTFK